MSQIRKVALFLLVAVATTGAVHQPLSAATVTVDERPVVQLASSFVLVEGWCADICNTACEGSCAQANPVGCSCYWVCENQEEGHQICTGDIGVKICAN